MRKFLLALGATLVSATLVFAGYRTPAVQPLTCAAAQWINSISANLVPSCGPIPANTITTAMLSTTNPPHGFETPVNLQLNATVASNALTIAVKTNSGTDASASNPILFGFRDATLSLGDPVWVPLTSALSFTINSGNTMGAANGVPFRLWIVAINNGGTVLVGAMNASASASGVITIYPLAVNNVLNTGAGTNGGSSAGTIYTSVASLTSKAVRIIGHMDWASGLTTAGTWASAPTTVELFGPDVKTPGSVIQTIYTPISSSFSCTTCTAYTVTTLTASITPTAAMNVIAAEVTGTANTSVSSSYCSVVIRRGTSTNVSPQYLVEANTSLMESVLTAKALDIPGAASATAYAAYLLTQTNGNSCGYPASGAGSPFGNVILTEIMG